MNHSGPRMFLCKSAALPLCVCVMLIIRCFLQYGAQNSEHDPCV